MTQGNFSGWADAAAWQWLASIYGANFANEAVRYLLAASLLWLIVHVLLKKRLAHRLIAQWPSARDVRREMSYSFLSLLVFAAVGMMTVMMVIKGHWVVYRNPTERGVAWLVASLPLMLIWHDFYFYWTHRLMHSRWLFRHVHGLHHRSRHPSPWAAYAFHPLEAMINALMMPLALCAVPLPGIVLFVVGIHQIVRNAHGHLAVETMPRGFARHWLGGRFTTTTHHHMHHETAKGNYGLWFTWWDRIGGTEQADYLARFDAATPAWPSGTSANKLSIVEQ